jgi:sodium-dependent dicarboxylate transporter 2/3/5
MAVWWITEAIPIPATALLPLALFPVLGIGDIRASASHYANPVLYLFMGGFMIAQAMQRWGLHRRLALHILRVMGTRPRNMVGGFMLATAFLSMWVSNTATTVMMLPIGLSVIDLTRRATGAADRHFALTLMLGIAYAASIGGMGTLIGTPPNALLAGFLEETYGVQIGFGQWMTIGVPLVIVMLPLTWLVLTRWIYPVRLADLPGGRETIAREITALGPVSRGETQVGVVFVLTALAWMTRPLLARWVPGLSDAGIAITGGLLLFLVPVDAKRGRFALDWESAAKLPWGVLVLFGGGLSLASAISRTGLAEWLGNAMSGLGTLPLVLIVVAVTAVLVFLTELTSNTASAATFLPILAAVAVGIGENPLLLVVPAALAASCAFMMPVATPPNAIVYGSGHVTVPQMARAGIVLNLLFIVALPLFALLLAGPVFGAHAGALPGWATP